MSALSSSTPTLPMPRQPSPLSFSSMSAHDPPSPRESADSLVLEHTPTSSSPPVSSRMFQHPSTLVPLKTSPVKPLPSPPVKGQIELPVDPSPDSLLLRSTFNALDHSAATLKRMSKSALASTRAYLALLEQVEKAEEEVFLRLGELGRWLEQGYGLSGPSVWNDENGIRKVRRNARKREREEMEVMVEHGIKAIKGELKRNGLGGLGAQSRFENNAKQYYQQTSDYLAPHHTSSGPSNGPSSSHIRHPIPRSPHLSSNDLAQASRLAQFDLARYSYHSTLLYAVPPTSIACVDLLVSLYNWAGGLLGELPEARKGSFTRREAASVAEELQKGDSHLLPSSSQAVSLNSSSANPKMLKSALSLSLEQLSTIRSDLLSAWAKRNIQTTELEDTVAERQAELDGGTLSELPNQPTSPRWGEGSSNPISGSSLDNKRPQRKMHKLHRSVGGKLRDLLSSSGSSRDLASLDKGERASRLSIDTAQTSRPVSMISSVRPVSGIISPTAAAESQLSLAPSPAIANAARRPSTSFPRPSIQPRHSMHATRDAEYVSPFIASQAANMPLPFESSPDLRAPLASPVALNTPDSKKIGGVGGLGAGGDEDERREEVGRKKEGVLWGAGVWEDLTKAPSKAKWENFWVVLDRSSIYEYRDSNFGKPDSAHAVIDLKFASVREGRGTDRRFVFEIVTPTKGKRLYQATSEYEMKQWLYAICNAIESCINGTSSVRTFDTSKLRTVSGSLDDHAVPTRHLFPIPSRNLGLGLPGARRSMPPPKSPLDDPNDKRQRKTSLKKVLRQSAEIAGEKWSSVMNSRSPSGVDLHRPSFLGQSGRSGSKTSTTPSIDEVPRPTSMILQSSIGNKSEGSGSDVHPHSSWYNETQDDIEKRVLEMAGLGLGLNSSVSSATSGTTSSGRRVVSDGANSALAKLEGRASSSDISRSRSAEIPIPPPTEPFQVDMALLRHIAELPSNKLCADCGKSMKSSRWASISLREVPMVAFLCIRCVGIHRSLGVHISKPRSVDLDIWTPESILLAEEWGNQRINGLWEKEKPGTIIPNDEDIAEYIKAKYVEGRWLNDEWRVKMGLSPPNTNVGRAL